MYRRMAQLHAQLIPYGVWFLWAAKDGLPNNSLAVNTINKFSLWNHVNDASIDGGTHLFVINDAKHNFIP